MTIIVYVTSYMASLGLDGLKIIYLYRKMKISCCNDHCNRYCNVINISGHRKCFEKAVSRIISCLLNENPMYLLLKKIYLLLCSVKFCTERVYDLFVILSHIFMPIDNFLLTFAYFAVLGSEIPIYTFLAGPVLATFVTMLYLTGCGIKNKTDEFHYNTEQNNVILQITPEAWWRHQMETFSALLVICVGNSPVPGEFPA